MKLKILLVLPLLGCTPTGDVDWPAVIRETSLAAADIDDAADMIESEDPELAASFRDIATALRALDGLEGEELSSAIDIAIAALDVAEEILEQVDPELKEDAEIYLFLVRTSLRRIDAYTETTEDDGPEDGDAGDAGLEEVQGGGLDSPDSPLG